MTSRCAIREAKVRLERAQPRKNTSLRAILENLATARRTLWFAESSS